MAKKLNKRSSVKWQIVALTVGVMAAMISILGGLMIYQSRTTANNLILETAHVTASYAANVIDTDALTEVKPGSENTDEYKKVQHSLQQVLNETNALYAFTMYTDGKKIYNGVVAGYNEKVGTEVNVNYSYLETVFKGNKLYDNTVYKTPQGRIINSYIPITDNNGKVVGVLGCAFDADCIKDVQNRNTAIVVVTVLTAIAILMVIIIRKVNSLLKPIDGAMLVLNKLDTGDLSENDDLQYDNNELGDIIEKTINVRNNLVDIIKDIHQQLALMANGDFKTLASNGNSFVGDYSHIYNSLLRIRDSLSETLNQVQVEANQVSIGANEISNGAQIVSSGAIMQATQIDMLSNDINNMVEEIQRTADNVHQIQDYMIRSSSAVNSSDESMHTLVAAMADLSEKSNQIIGMTKVINDIAFQTNILALNAAVEAARAGEAGKGFAVVADEVRNLAAKSAESAKDAEDVVKQTIDVIGNSTDIVQVTAKHLADVVAVNNEMSIKANEIEALCSSQVDKIENIGTSINQVSTVIQSNSATAEESAAASEELSAQAETLNQLVSQFKLNM